MRAAHIEDGKVVNIIEVESLDVAPGGMTLVDANGADIGDEWDGEKFAKPVPPAPDLVARKKELAGEIESAALAVFAKPVTLARVYERRETEAAAFRDAGFAGDPGEYVKNFADPAGLSYESAAKLVLQQAANLRAAQDKLEALRMRKNEVLRAPSVDDAELIAAEVRAGIHAIATAIG